MRFVVTTRRTRFTGLRAAWRLRTTFLPVQGLHDWTVWARAFGTSAICIAPLPMIAPPQVQAQSLARAIRTDIGFSFFPVAGVKRHRPAPPIHLRYNPKGQSFVNAAIVLTAFACPRAGIAAQNQPKTRYMSQNRTENAVILCNWLIFGPKSHGAAGGGARRPTIQNRCFCRAGSSRLHGLSLSTASALVSSRTAGYRRATPCTA